MSPSKALSTLLAQYPAHRLGKAHALFRIVRKVGKNR